MKLSEALPSGTTMIMQANDEYWYCKSPSGTEIQLSSFHKMEIQQSLLSTTQKILQLHRNIVLLLIVPKFPKMIY
ncbi:MAG: hypothetical protein ACLVI9_05680 [Anaerostipes hadrus]